MTMIAISGNTYPVRESLRSLGGRWNPQQKTWMVPSDKAAEARTLVGGAPRSTGYRPRKCVVCGKVESKDSRGYSIVTIYRSGECQDCYEERKMGY